MWAAVSAAEGLLDGWKSGLAVEDGGLPDVDAEALLEGCLEDEDLDEGVDDSDLDRFGWFKGAGEGVDAEEEDL